MATNTKVVQPPAVIGILGGGQLGQMLSLAARSLGYGIAVLDPGTPCSAGPIADYVFTAAYDDLQAAEQLANTADVLTYEFENIPAPVVAALETNSYFPQGAHILHLSQDRLREKQALEAAGLQTAPYRAVTKASELHQAVAALGLPAILKTCTGGYDGKGQHLLQTAADVDALATQMPETGHWVLEGYVPFVKELSVIVVRTPAGESQCFPVVENQHRDGILHRTTAGMTWPDGVEAKAQQWARQFADSVKLVGPLAIELFLLSDGTILANEMAPRPHNSGHWTLDGCNISQFQQHIRSICGLPLLEPVIIQPTVMLNLLGQHVPALMDHWGNLPAGAFVHLYGKTEARHGRKMGHINCCGRTLAEAAAAADAVETILQMRCCGEEG